MTSRARTIGAAVALCALSICASAAASASAAELTAVTCENRGIASKYANSNCSTSEEGGNFETTAIPLNTKTNVEGTTTGAGAEGEVPALRATIAATNLTIKCTASHTVAGTVTNSEPEVGGKKVMKITTTAERITYTGCHAYLKSNETKWCEVEEITGPTPGTTEMISTVPVQGTTTGVNHQVIVEPESGTVFTEFGIESKTQAAGHECFFNNTVAVQVKGKVEGEANTTTHSHLTFTEANNGTALKIGGSEVTASYLDTIGGTMEGTGVKVGAQTF